MIKNISYNDKKVTGEINSLVGDAYSWFERIKIAGIKGSPKFKVLLARENIKNIFLKTNSNGLCPIELRPKGIIVWFSW